MTPDRDDVDPGMVAPSELSDRARSVEKEW